MSEYKDNFSDYPLRCSKLWRLFQEQAEEAKLDVTFMLMVASGGLAAPWEHLRVQDKHLQLPDHPAFTKKQLADYRKVRDALKETIDAKLTDDDDNRLMSGVKLKNWGYFQVDEAQDIREKAESCGGGLPDQYTGHTLLTLMRNALAHNNVYAYSGGGKVSKGEKQITHLALYSEKRNRVERHDEKGCVEVTYEVPYYRALTLPVDGFQRFLTNWFEELRRCSADVTQAPLSASIADAIDSA